MDLENSGTRDVPKSAVRRHCGNWRIEKKTEFVGAAFQTIEDQSPRILGGLELT